MIKIVFVALVGVVASMMLKNINSNVRVAVAIITGIVIIGLLYSDINNLIKVFDAFSSGYGIQDNYVKLLLKVLGISYITQLGVSLTEECGEKFISKKIEFAGKILIISLSVPVLINLLNTVIGLI